MNHSSHRRRWLKQAGVLSSLGLISCGLNIGELSSSVAEAVYADEDPRVGAGQWNLDLLAESEPLIQAAIADGQMPGCVICIGSRTEQVWLKAYGQRQVEPTPEPMTVDTIFDLASLTKPIVTATSVMALVDKQKIQLELPVAAYIPEFAAGGKEELTVEDLLVHRSGLIPDNPMSDYEQGIDEAWMRIWQLKPRYPRSSRFQYSDVNFLVLGKLVERVSGVSLDRFATNHIFEPLQMSDTSYCPKAEARARTAPTERQRGEWLRGTVHDPRAAALGGVAGHAGLFSTAADLMRYSQAMLKLSSTLLNSGKDGTPFSSHAFQRMIQSVPIGSEVRGLGWDKASSYSANGGQGKSSEAFGHGGFTGTVLWIDPQQDWFFIFLSSRLHPDGKGAVNGLAGQIATRVSQARKRSAG